MAAKNYQPDTEVYAYQSRSIGKTLGAADLRAQFEEQARWYGCFFKGWLPADRDAAILDVPCGHGNLLWFLKKQGYQNVRGLDIDEGRVQIAHGLGLDAASLGDGLAAIAELDGEADAIFSLDFLEHLEKPDAFAFLKNCHKALKPGGLLVVRMPVTDNPMGAFDLFADFTHRWSAGSSVIANLLKMSDFREVAVRDERPVPYKPLNYLRLGIFLALSKIHNGYLRLLGLPGYSVWSRSAFFFARK